MKKGHIYEILLLVAVIIFVGIFLVTDASMKAEGIEGWGGTDGEGSAIVEATGYEPWIEDTAFTPPSGEIESCLFSLQGVIGGLLIGWVFGSWLTERRLKAKN